MESIEQTLDRLEKIYDAAVESEATDALSMTVRRLATAGPAAYWRSHGVAR